MMIQFTRHLITCGLVIEPEHVQENGIFTFTYSDRRFFAIGAEPYSLVICPQGYIDKPWRIEGKRTTNENDEIEIWYIGTMEACIAEFERITAKIRDAGHQITEPDNYDFEKSIREYHKRFLADPFWSGQSEQN